jgi:mono/diheme cytochrome c family protein
VTQMVLMIGGLVLFLIAAPPIRAQEAQAFSPTAYFQKNCGTCHAAEGISRAPSPAALRALTPEAVYSTITTGSMKERTTGLNGSTAHRPCRNPHRAEIRCSGGS